MLARRVATAVILAAVGLPAIFVGGIPYLLLIAFFLGVASWEYSRLCRRARYQPLSVLTVGGVLAILTARALFPLWAEETLTVLVLLAMGVHLMRYERGRDEAALDFALTVGGIVYLGWVGAYLLDVRNLPGGVWWLFLVLLPVWLADSGAYFVGVRWGRHRLSPRLSPKKSWEGYWAGVVLGTLGGIWFAWLWKRFGLLDVPLWSGAIIGLVLSLFTTLGDLGESMFKRWVGVKDSGNLFPGHGGVFDRLDSWLWAAALGYLLALWLQHVRGF